MTYAVVGIALSTTLAGLAEARSLCPLASALVERPPPNVIPDFAWIDGARKLSSLALA